MEIEPAAEWQRLSAHYREMYDDELLNLAGQIGDLTEMAQQVLRDELKRRGLSAERKPPVRPVIDPAGSPDDDIDPSTAEALEREKGGPVEFTWKTPLCECGEYSEAWQVAETLRRARIESWIEQPPGAASLSDYRVVVAADQLEEARAILAQPIPQEIIDASRQEVPEYEAPACPGCGASDPVLESADPVNAWYCESCGREWTDTAEEAG